MAHTAHPQPGPAPAPHPDAAAVARLVGGYRWRLGVERVLPAVLWSACAGLLLTALARALGQAGLLGDVAAVQAVVGLLPTLGLLAGLARWPSALAAARQADRRLGLEERLGTAVDLTSQPHHASPPIVRAQVADALDRARAARRRWPSPLFAAVDHLAAVAGLGMLAVGALALLSAGGDLPASTATLVTPPGDRLGALEVPREAAVPEPPPLVNLEPPLPIQFAPRPPDASQQGAAEADPARQAALDRLADALGQVSATQPAAEQLASGQYSQAADELAQLAVDVDQLSPAARQALAEALRNAADATASTESALADAERRAAEALGGSNYERQRRALQDLAQQLDRSSTGLARSPQPASPGQAQPGDAAGEQDRLGDVSDGSGQPGDGGTAGSTPPGAGAPGAGGDGSGTTRPAPGQNQRLATAGEQVEVPSAVNDAAAVRPAGPNAPTEELQDGLGAGGAREALRPQEMGSVVPERNALPTDARRDLVREYFR
jgi:hypothetical protein